LANKEGGKGLSSPKGKGKGKTDDPRHTWATARRPTDGKGGSRTPHQMGSSSRGTHQTQAQSVLGSTRHTAAINSPVHTAQAPPDGPPLKPEGLVPRAKQKGKSHLSKISLQTTKATNHG
jgi:hypothetical protein